MCSALSLVETFVAGLQTKLTPPPSLPPPPPPPPPPQCPPQTPPQHHHHHYHHHHLRYHRYPSTAIKSNNSNNYYNSNKNTCTNTKSATTDFTPFSTTARYRWRRPGANNGCSERREQVPPAGQPSLGGPPHVARPAVLLQGEPIRIIKPSVHFSFHNVSLQCSVLTHRFERQSKHQRKEYF